MSKLILFQGDSITDAGRDYGNPQSHAGTGYPTLVKARLGFDHPGEYTFINKGIGGNRIRDVYARIKADIINLKPDYMSLLIGVNDIWHEIDSQNGSTPEMFDKVYRLLLDEIFEALPDIKIMLLAPFVLHGSATMSFEGRPDKWDRFKSGVAALAKVVEKIAEDYSLPLITLQEKFDKACTLAENAYWLADGVHPTAMGHELIAREWVKTFNELK